MGLVIYHCLINRVSFVFHPGYEPAIPVVGQHTWEWGLSSFEIAFDSSLKDESIAISFGRSGFDGSPAFRLAWNLGQSVLKFGLSVRLKRKIDIPCRSVKFCDPRSVRSTWLNSLGRPGPS